MLVITDETAGVTILTINDDGLICFGFGLPVSPLSITGIAMVDTNGLISSQRVTSSALAGAHGSVTVEYGAEAIVNTSPGRIPTVALDVSWPAVTITFTPARPGVPGFCNPPDPNWIATSHKLVDLVAGGFAVRNQDLDHSAGQCLSPNNKTIDYRWM